MAELIISFVVLIVCGLISQHISSGKGRSYGFWWGFMLGLLGIFITVLLKDKSKQ